jgi:hypothetical protein
VQSWIDPLRDGIEPRREPSDPLCHFIGPTDVSIDSLGHSIGLFG